MQLGYVPCVCSYCILIPWFTFHIGAGSSSNQQVYLPLPVIAAMSLSPTSASGQRPSAQGQGPGVVWPPIVDAFRCFGALVGHFILRKVAAAFDDSKALVDAAGSWGGGSGGLGSLGVSEQAF